MRDCDQSLRQSAEFPSRSFFSRQTIAKSSGHGVLPFGKGLID